MWCLNEKWTESPVSGVANSGSRVRGAGSSGTGTQEAGADSPERGGTVGTVNSSGTGGGGIDPPAMPLDPTLSRLISRLATMIVEKVGERGLSGGQPVGVFGIRVRKRNKQGCIHNGGWKLCCFEKRFVLIRSFPSLYISLVQAWSALIMTHFIRAFFSPKS